MGLLVSVVKARCMLVIVIGAAAMLIGCGEVEFTDKERDKWVEWCWTYTDQSSCGELGDSMEKAINDKGYDEECTVNDVTAMARSRSRVSADGRLFLEECRPPDPCIEIKAE